MALEYNYDAQARVISIGCSGEISIGERIHFVNQLLDDQCLPERASILIDVNQVTNAPASDEIGAIGALIQRLLLRFSDRVAIVNATVGHVMLSHMVSFSVGDTRGKVRVFTTMAEARDWLGE